MNSATMDLFFVLFLAIMAVAGYMKGFIVRLYDLVMLIIVLFLSTILSKPLASIFKIYSYSETDMISQMIGQIINQIIIFIVLFMSLFLIKYVIGILLKPILNKLTNFFHITKWLNHSLGCLLGIGESLIIWYIVIVFIFIPFYPRASFIVNDTYLTKSVIRIVPQVSEEIVTTSQDVQFDKKYSIETLTRLALVAYKYDILSDEQFKKIFDEYIGSSLQNQKISLSDHQKEWILKKINSNDYTDDEIKNILRKVIESDINENKF